MGKYDPKEIAIWLYNANGEGATDEEFAEVFATMAKMRRNKYSLTTEQLEPSDVTGFDIGKLCRWIQESLEEIIHDEEVDTYAWWKKSTPSETDKVIGALMKMAVTNSDDEKYEGAMQLASTILGISEEKVADLLYDGKEGEQDG